MPLEYNQDAPPSLDELEAKNLVAHFFDNNQAAATIVTRPKNTMRTTTNRIMTPGSELMSVREVVSASSRAGTAVAPIPPYTNLSL